MPLQLYALQWYDTIAKHIQWYVTTFSTYNDRHITGNPKRSIIVISENEVLLLSGKRRHNQCQPKGALFLSPKRSVLHSPQRDIIMLDISLATQREALLLSVKTRYYCCHAKGGTINVSPKGLYFFDPKKVTITLTPKGYHCHSKGTPLLLTRRSTIIQKGLPSLWAKTSTSIQKGHHHGITVR